MMENSDSGDESLLNDNSSVVYQRPTQWWRRLTPSVRASEESERIVVVNTVTVCEQREQVIVMKDNRPSIDDQFYLSPVNSFDSYISPSAGGRKKNLFTRRNIIPVADDPPIENITSCSVSHVFGKENSHYSDVNPESICSSFGDHPKQRRTIFKPPRLSERNKKKSLYKDVLRRSSIIQSKNQTDSHSPDDNVEPNDQNLGDQSRKRRKSMPETQTKKMAKGDFDAKNVPNPLNSTLENAHKNEVRALSDSTILSIDDSHQKKSTKSIFKLPKKNSPKNRNQYLAAISWDKNSVEHNNISEIDDLHHENSLQISPIIGTPASMFKNLASSTVIGESLSPRSTGSHILKRPSWRLSAVTNNDAEISKQLDKHGSNPEITVTNFQEKSANVNRNNSTEFTPESVRKLRSMRDEDSVNMNFMPKKTRTPDRFSTVNVLQNNTEEKLQSLNQSEIDRAFIEEMQAKRTNPPVRNSLFIQRDPSINMDNELNNSDDSVNEMNNSKDNEGLPKLYPMRHSEIPIPIHVPDPDEESETEIVESQKRIRKSSNISTNKNNLAVNLNIDVVHQVDKTDQTLGIKEIIQDKDISSKKINNNNAIIDENNFPENHNVNVSKHQILENAPRPEIEIIQDKDISSKKINNSNAIIDENNFSENRNVNVSKYQMLEDAPGPEIEIIQDKDISSKNITKSNAIIDENNFSENHNVNVSKHQMLEDAPRPEIQEIIQDPAEIPVIDSSAYIVTVDKSGNISMNNTGHQINNVNCTFETAPQGKNEVAQNIPDVAAVNKSVSPISIESNENVPLNKNILAENFNTDVVHQDNKNNESQEVVPRVEIQEMILDSVNISAVNVPLSYQKTDECGDTSSNENTPAENLNANRGNETTHTLGVMPEVEIGAIIKQVRISNVSDENIFDIPNLSNRVNSISGDPLKMIEMVAEKERSQLRSILNNTKNLSGNSYNMDNFITVDEVGDESSKQSSVAHSIFLDTEKTQKSRKNDESNFHSTQIDTTSNISCTMELTLVDGVGESLSNDKLRSSTFSENIEKSTASSASKLFESQDDSNETSEPSIVDKKLFAKLNWRELIFEEPNKIYDEATNERCQRIMDRIVNGEKKKQKWATDIANNEKKLDEYLGRTKVVINSPIKTIANKSEKPKIAQSKNNLHINKNPKLPGNFSSVYKKPKLYMKEAWITKHLYKFIQSKLEPKYGIKTLMKSEKFIIYLAKVVNEVTKLKEDFFVHVENLKETMAQLDIVYSHEDFHRFCRDYLPYYFQIKAIPACGHDVPGIRGGVFDPIMEEDD